jgi:hypothetical protein
VPSAQAAQEQAARRSLARLHQHVRHELRSRRLLFRQWHRALFGLRDHPDPLVIAARATVIAPFRVVWRITPWISTILDGVEALKGLTVDQRNVVVFVAAEFYASHALEREHDHNSLSDRQDRELHRLVKSVKRFERRADSLVLTAYLSRSLEYAKAHTARARARFRDARTSLLCGEIPEVLTYALFRVFREGAELNVGRAERRVNQILSQLFACHAMPDEGRAPTVRMRYQRLVQEPTERRNAGDLRRRDRLGHHFPCARWDGFLRDTLGLPIPDHSLAPR